MSEFGYIPEAPEQSELQVQGILSPTDIYNLVRSDKYPVGQLELINTYDITSGVSNLDLTNIQENKYSAHLLTINNMQGSTAGGVEYQYGVGGSIQTGTLYKWADKDCASNSSFSESRNTVTYNAFGNGANPDNGHIWFYNLGSPTRYVHSTWHGVSQISVANIFVSSWGSNVFYQTSSVDTIRLRISSASYTLTGKFALYGLRNS